MTAPSPKAPPESYPDFLRRIEAFLADTLCKEEIDDQDYVAGSSRIEFHAEHLRKQRQILIEAHEPSAQERTNEFEEALVERLLQRRDFNLLILLGGLGAGKTTTVKFIQRRLTERRDQLRQTFHCTCQVCNRDPIYLDFRALGQKRALRSDTVVTEVFREIRIKTYQKIITEWLHRIGLNPGRIGSKDPEYMVLRRLLIANDLFGFHGAEHSGLTDLADPDLTLEFHLTESCLSEREVLDLIQQYRRPAMNYQSKLRAVTDDPNHSQDFMVLILQFFLYRCNPLNPMNLVIIDNLDQLPTNQIEDILSELHDVATRTSGLPLLLPLRPSSINPYGFVRDLVFRYHYGPNNFEMVLNRLQRYVLSRSRDELRIPRKRNDNPFYKPPSEAEIDVLLIISYIYAKVMASGLKSPQRREVPIQVHEDHRFLNQISVGGGTLLSLAETVDALVGACCRYGLDVMKRYFYNCYQNPVFLRRMAQLRISEHLTKGARLQYGELVTFLLRDPIGGGRVSRVVNLFSPTRVGSNPGWPSLAKLRILGLLSRDQRQQVGAIIQSLGSFGVPAELAVEALNSLQDKFRLLLWFSTNRPLSLRDNQSLDEDVVISEHGERYFRRIVGDFEYVWYCATGLQKRQYSYSGLKFTLKLDDYRRLVQQLGLTEWKQVLFERFRAGCLPDIGGVGRSTQMSVLAVLYSSMSRVLLSAGIIMRVHGGKAQLVRELYPLLTAICGELLFWQQKYMVAYGSNFYLYEYEDELQELRAKVAELADEEFVPEELGRLLGGLHKSWAEEPRSQRGLQLQPDAPPTEDIVTTLARYGRGLIPGVERWSTSLDSNRRVAVFLARFLKTRSQLSNLLSSSLPTFSELYRSVSHLLGDIQAVVASAAEIASTGENLLHWCVDEKAVLENVVEILRENQYDVVQVTNLEMMTECKRKFNNIIEAAEQLARHFALEDTWHLSHRWQ